MLKIMLDIFLQSLSNVHLTLGLSKAYSYTKTTMMASTTTMNLVPVLLKLIFLFYSAVLG